MIRVFKNELNWFLFSVAPYAEVQPVFRRSVQIYVCVSLYLDCERVGCDESGCCHVATGKAAVDDDGVGEIVIRAIGMPGWFFLVVIGLCSHRL